MNNFEDFKKKSFIPTKIKTEQERKNYKIVNDFKEESDKIIYSTNFTQNRYNGIPKLNIDNYNTIKNNMYRNKNQCKEIENNRTNIGYREGTINYNDNYSLIRYNNNDRIKERERKKENQIIYDKNVYNETDAYKPLIYKMSKALDLYNFPKQTRKKDII